MIPVFVSGIFYFSLCPLALVANKLIKTDGALAKATLHPFLLLKGRLLYLLLYAVKVRFPSRCNHAL